MIKMLALDLDGTLAVENHQVLPNTKAALHDLSDSGVEIVIATGRRYRTTRFVIENLGMNVFAVCNGGALVKDPDMKTLHRDSFCVAELVDLARDLGLNLFAQRDAHDHGGPDFVIDEGHAWNAMTQKHFDNNIEWSGKGDLTSKEQHFLVCGAFGPAEPLEQLAERVASTFPNDYNTIIVPHLQTGYFYCEITQRHVDKWHGLSKIGDRLGIADTAISAVGDELNDVPMISRAGLGFAMANGNEALQALAHHICGPNEADGIVDVVNHIMALNSAE